MSSYSKYTPKNKNDKEENKIDFVKRTLIQIISCVLIIIISFFINQSKLPFLKETKNSVSYFLKTNYDFSGTYIKIKELINKNNNNKQEEK